MSILFALTAVLILALSCFFGVEYARFQKQRSAWLALAAELNLQAAFSGFHQTHLTGEIRGYPVSIEASMRSGDQHTRILIPMVNPNNKKLSLSSVPPSGPDVQDLSLVKHVLDPVLAYSNDMIFSSLVLTPAVKEQANLVFASPEAGMVQIKGEAVSYESEEFPETADAIIQLAPIVELMCRMKDSLKFK
jgi:hypothetical protein